MTIGDCSKTSRIRKLSNINEKTNMGTNKYEAGKISQIDNICKTIEIPI